MIEENDWRIQGQESFLYDKTFYKHLFKERSGKDDHAHCSFCWAKFDCSEISQAGLSTLDDEYWVCEECFTDFQERYKLHVWDPGEYKEKSLGNILEREIGSYQGHKNIFPADRVIRTLQKVLQLDVMPISGKISPVIFYRLSEKTLESRMEVIDRLGLEIDNGTISDFQETIIELKNMMNSKLITDNRLQKAYILYEFIARDYRILETKEGTINGLFKVE